MKPTLGEQDADWFRQYVSAPDDDTLEWFLERVAILCESGFSSLQARNITYSEFLKTRHGHLRSTS